MELCGCRCRLGSGDFAGGCCRRKERQGVGITQYIMMLLPRKQSEDVEDISRRRWWDQGTEVFWIGRAPKRVS